MTRSTQSHSHGKTPITHRATALGASPKSNPAPSADLLEKPSDEPKLSVKRGLWRNQYEAINFMRLFDPDTAQVTDVRPGEVYLGYGEWDSEATAREIAVGCALNPDSDQGSGDAKYLGPVFFPADDKPPD